MQDHTQAKLVKCDRCGAMNRAVFRPDKKAVCGRCKAGLAYPSSSPVIITDANFKEEVENSSAPVLLDLWAEWCGPCRMLTPIIEEVAAETAGKVKVGKLNVDQNPRTAARFRVQSIPTLLILQNGREVKRMVGVQSKTAILRQINEAAVL